MRHHIWKTSNSYSVALLMKATAFNKQELHQNYINPLQSRGVDASEIIGFTLEYDAKKVSVKYAKEYLAQLLPELHGLGIKYLLCTDANYFKLLTKESKAESHLGYVLPCKLEGFEHMHVVLSLNYQQLIYNPDLQAKLDQSLDALANHTKSVYQAPGTGVIHKAIYPQGTQAIRETLQALHTYPELTCDIEAFSLRFWEAGIGTISFAVDEHNGVAFAVDYIPVTQEMREAAKLIDFPIPDDTHGLQKKNHEVRALLKEFFETYQGKLTFHHAGYDVKVMIYTLWMKSLLDTEGLLTGLEIMTRSLDDTKIIAYLATNSTAGNVLGLKPLAQEFAGNYAMDNIKDIRLIPLADLLQYNLVDALSTWYVKKKYYPIMVQDKQEELYRTLKLPTLKLILQIELTGMPMGKQKIQEIKTKLEGMRDGYVRTIQASAVLAPFEHLMTERAWVKDYEQRRDKAKNPGKIMPKDQATFPKHEFNPNSGPQLQVLLYEVLKLPVIDKTETKQPATGADTLEKLINHVTDPSHKDLIEALIGHGQVVKILNTFIPAFECAIAKADDGIVWLHGSFNIGGTVSGRLSSSDPNLQNLPANSIFGKVIKEAFFAPPGKVFMGADFNSLEDYISALTTKDPNKLLVYEKGYCGHCLRAAYYFKDELIAEGINIDLDDPKSVNILKDIKHWTRQSGKEPTFLLTYGGTYHGLMSNLGWNEEKSKRIEGNYHDLYKVSDEYVQARLQRANKDGYVEVAFGLRVRTPLIKQVIWNGPKVPYEAAAEGRTAGNALGQSYGQLNDRAAVEFMQKVWASPYRLDIWPVALIHDASYYVATDTPEIIEWANRELIKSMQWQELPEIQHPTVKLGAALDLFWPNWTNPITLPNNASQADIIKICIDAKADYYKLKEAA